MKAATGTIQFCRDWIEGRLNKRQYMHYYVVKTDHAEFMMKGNEKPDLVAIKDKFDNIFIPDNTLRHYSLIEERASRNPFFALIGEGYKYRYFLLTEEAISTIGPELSTWRTLDWLQVVNNPSNLTVQLALVEVGDAYYLTKHYPKDDERNKVITLKQWLEFEDLSNAKLNSNTIQPYSTLSKVGSTNHKTISEIRNSFAVYAGEFADRATVSEGMMYVPTNYETLESLIGSEVQAALNSRPNPIQFGVPPEIINFEKLEEKKPFDPTQIDSYSNKCFLNVSTVLNGRNMQHLKDWQKFLRGHLDNEIAENLINFIEADDAWLVKHQDKLKPFTDGKVAKARILQETLSGFCLLLEENNPSIMNTHVIYVKGILLSDYDKKLIARYPTFTKIVPIPSISKPREIQEVIDHASE